MSIYELIRYCLTNANLFGFVYLMVTLIIIFLILPTLYNYKNNYSNARLSKFIIIIVIGIFNSFILYTVVCNHMSYIDSSNAFSNSISLVKNVFKPIIYFGMALLALRDAKVYKKIKNLIINRNQK